MAEGNGTDPNEALRQDLHRSWEDHKRMDRNLERLHADVKQQTKNLNKLLGALRELIDRIPPENLRPKTE